MAGPPTSRCPVSVFDAYADVGGNSIDASNSCLVEHGRSESIIGRWMADRGNRGQVVVATKVGGGRGPSLTGSVARCCITPPSGSRSWEQDPTAVCTDALRQLFDLSIPG